MAPLRKVIKLYCIVLYCTQSYSVLAIKGAQCTTIEWTCNGIIATQRLYSLYFQGGTKMNGLAFSHM